MIIFDAPVSPDALTAFIREVPTPAGLTLVPLVPKTQSFSNRFSWSEVTRTNRTARFRSFDGRIHVSDRDTGAQAEVSLLPLSDSLNQGEYETLQLAFARTGGTRTEALTNAIYNDAEVLTRHAWNRLELAIGDILADGKLTINDDGFQGEADFGVPADQIVTAGTKWDAGGKVLADLEAWSDVAAKGGSNMTDMIVSRKTLRKMLRAKDVVDSVYGAQTGRTSVTVEDLRTALADLNLPANITVSDTVLDVDGVATRAIPEDKVIMTAAPISELIEVRFGVSATALELVNSNHAEMSFEDAPGLVGVIVKEGPPYRQFSFIDGVVMPILRDGKSLMVASI